MHAVVKYLVSLAVAVLFLLPIPARAAGGKDIVRATLKNGLRVVIVRNALAPVVTTEVNYLAGSNEAPEGFPGMAHAEEHMMFRGSPGFSASQFSTISAALGGDSNADTQQVVTQYFLTVPADALDAALRIESIRMRAALNTEALWKLERGAIEQEVAQDFSNPRYIFYTRLLEALFPETPYAHDALGTRPSFDKTTGAMLDTFHRDWYGPNNAILVIVGDVDPDRALALVKRHFGPIPRRAVPPNVSSSAAVPDASRVQDEVILGETLGVTRDHPDYYSLQVGTHVLAGAFYATRLYRDLREDTGLVYVVQAMFNSGKTRAVYSVFYGCDPGNVSKARALVERDLREMQTTPVSADELRQAKTLLIRNIPLSESSVDGIAGTLLDLSQKDLPLDEPVRAAQRYQRITAEQVRAAFLKWVRPADFVQVTLGPEGK